MQTTPFRSPSRALSTMESGNPWPPPLFRCTRVSPAACAASYVAVAGGSVGLRGRGGTGVLVVPGSLGEALVSPSESIRACGLSLAASISASASCSGSVTVRFQVFLMES